MFYECEYVKPLFIWILKCLSNVCNFKPSSNIKYIFSYQNIICNLFIYMYVIIIWRTRKENLRIGDLKNVFIRGLSNYKNLIKHMPSKKCKKLSDKIIALDIDKLIDL